MGNVKVANSREGGGGSASSVEARYVVRVRPAEGRKENGERRKVTGATVKTKARVGGGNRKEL